MSNNGAPTIDDWIELLNKDYFFLVEGAHSVFRENKNADMKDAIYLEKVGVDAFRLAWDLHEVHKQVKFKDEDSGEMVEKTVRQKVGTTWLKSKNRRTYIKKAFRPIGECPKEYYNMFRGFNYRPKESGSCELYKKHVLQGICCGNEVYYEYIMNWMARAIQYPDRVGEVIIVIRGKKGTGKNTLVEFFGDLFNRAHFKQFQNRKYITGEFSQQLEGVVVLFSNEAIWAANKTDEGVLKAMATDGSRTGEAKGKDATELKNYLHVFMATNEDWAVPTSWDERRFFVIKTADDRMQKEQYLSIRNEMMNGGYERLLWELQNRDLSKFDPMNYPITEELTQQTELSLHGVDAWWLEVHKTGQIVPGIDWSEPIPKEVVLKAYEDFCISNSVRYGKKTASTLGRFLKEQLWPLLKPVSADKPEDKVIAMSYKMADGYYKEMGLLKSTAKQLWHYNFPPLDECRKLYASRTKQIIKWDAPFVSVDAGKNSKVMSLADAVGNTSAM